MTLFGAIAQVWRGRVAFEDEFWHTPGREPWLWVLLILASSCVAQALSPDESPWWAYAANLVTLGLVYFPGRLVKALSLLLSGKAMVDVALFEMQARLGISQEWLVALGYVVMVWSFIAMLRLMLTYLRTSKVAFRHKAAQAK